MPPFVTEQSTAQHMRLSTQPTRYHSTTAAMAHRTKVSTCFLCFSSSASSRFIFSWSPPIRFSMYQELRKQTTRSSNAGLQVSQIAATLTVVHHRPVTLARPHGAQIWCHRTHTHTNTQTTPIEHIDNLHCRYISGRIPNSWWWDLKNDTWNNERLEAQRRPSKFTDLLFGSSKKPFHDERFRKYNKKYVSDPRGEKNRAPSLVGQSSIFLARQLFGELFPGILLALDVVGVVIRVST
jgi:hypothetical protein